MVEFAESKSGPEINKGGLRVWLRSLDHGDMVSGELQVSGKIVADIIWFEPKGIFSSRLVNGARDLKSFFCDVESSRFGKWTPEYITGFTDKDTARLAVRIGMSIGEPDSGLFPIIGNISDLSAKLKQLENSRMLEAVTARAEKQKQKQEYNL